MPLLRKREEGGGAYILHGLLRPPGFIPLDALCVDPAGDDRVEQVLRNTRSWEGREIGRMSSAGGDDGVYEIKREGEKEREERADEESTALKAGGFPQG